MAQMKYSKIKVTVDSVAGKCPLGNTPGKEFFIERTTPAGMCLSAFNSINPAIKHESSSDICQYRDVVINCRKYSDTSIVLGGAGYSIFPQATLDFLDADIGIQGEGENSFLTKLIFYNFKLLLKLD